MPKSSRWEKQSNNSSSIQTSMSTHLNEAVIRLVWIIVPDIAHPYPLTPYYELALHDRQCASKFQYFFNRDYRA